MLESLRKVGVAVSAAAIGLSSAACGTTGANKVQSSEPGASAVDLDSVPGFGRSEEANNRDDLLATYDVWLREKKISACMRESGFGYSMRISMPDQTLRQVASRPDVSAASRGLDTARYVPPDFVNDMAQADVANEGMHPDRYYLALYGENERGVKEGIDANGDGSIADKGCAAAARGEIPGIWGFRDKYADALIEIQTEVDESLTEVREDFATCVEGLLGERAESAKELRSLLDTVTATEQSVRSLQGECIEPYEEARRAATIMKQEMFLSEQDGTEEHIALYRERMENALSDEHFLSVLQVASQATRPARRE